MRRDLSGYHQFGPYLDHYGSFEVFYSRKGFEPGGWYWWPCFPGCLPDDDAHGPFKTAAEAYRDAMGECQ
jgi:hypothetical protein